MFAESGTFLNTEGSGLFRLQSACNHSCAPNAESSFPYGNHRIQLKAIDVIMPGDEIYISYLDECSLQRSRHSRQKVTKKLFVLFHCLKKIEILPDLLGFFFYYLFMDNLQQN